MFSIFVQFLRSDIQAIFPNVISPFEPSWCHADWMIAVKRATVAWLWLTWRFCRQPKLCPYDTLSIFDGLSVLSFFQFGTIQFVASINVIYENSTEKKKSIFRQFVCVYVNDVKRMNAILKLKTKMWFDCTWL